jgi:pilus assembly protein CpaD
MRRLQKTAARRTRVAAQAAAIASFAALLGGCYQTTTAQVVETPYPADYRERHPITIKEGAHTVEIFVGRNRGGLTPEQRAAVLAFAQGWRRDATSGVIIAVPQGGPTARAAADSMREVHSILNASGIPARAVYVRRYRPAPSALASIKISYSKLVANAGPCGDWPKDLGPSVDGNDFSNLDYWNYGCASQHNLAAMVDNPADLVQPRGETPAYAARRSVAIDNYRQGKDPSGLYGKLYDEGKISDVGK